MVPADGSQHCRTGILHHIGGIQQTSHSRFQYDYIAALFPKIPESQRCLHFKGSGMGRPLLLHLFTGLFYQLHALTERFFCNRSVVYLYAFPVFEKDRRQESSNPVTTVFQH